MDLAFYGSYNSCFTYPDARHYFVYFKLLSTIFSKRQLRIASKILAITKERAFLEATYYIFSRS